MQKGRFISFEGIDGCGKSTQITLLSKYLSERGVPLVVAREPGGTSLGEVIRRVTKYASGVYDCFNKTRGFYQEQHSFKVIDSEEDRTPESEILLFLAARIEFTKKVVIPNIRHGITVIADRFCDSTRAYQGGGRFNHREDIIDLIEDLNRFALRGDSPAEIFYPNATFLLDIPYSTSIERSKNRGEKSDALESLGEEFFQRVIAEYHSIAKEYPKRFKIIDGTLPEEEIFNQGILPKIQDILRT